MQRGHWKAECTAVGYGPGAGYYGGVPYGQQGDPYGGAGMPGAGNVHVIAGRGRSETYIDITSRGKTIYALLDSGCDRLCRNARITPVDSKLYAANGSPISVVGMTRLLFEIQGMQMHADVFLSEDLDELIFGYEFLEGNNCEWLFGEHRIVINGLSVPLRNRPSKGLVRRIYVCEPVVIPANTSMNVPVRLPFVNMCTPSNEWVTESREVRPGLFAARTLLAHDDRYAAVAFMNVSGVDQTLREGYCYSLFPSSRSAK